MTSEEVLQEAVRRGDPETFQWHLIQQLALFGELDIHLVFTADVGRRPLAIVVARATLAAGWDEDPRVTLGLVELGQHFDADNIKACRGVIDLLTTY